MGLRRATYGAAIRLALVLSVAASILAIALSTVGDVSTFGLIAAVATVGFTTSWIQTGRVVRATTRNSHRITVVAHH